MLDMKVEEERDLAQYRDISAPYIVTKLPDVSFIFLFSDIIYNLKKVNSSLSKVQILNSNSFFDFQTGALTYRAFSNAELDRVKLLIS